MVDERDPPGPIDETQIFDKVTAKRKGLPYYITGALDRRTLNNPDGENFPIGDGRVVGGFLNYPLQKGKKYNWAFLTVWDVDGKPVIGFYRGKGFHHKLVVKKFLKFHQFLSATSLA